MNHTIEQIIRSTMDRVGMDVEIREEQNGINMTYQFIYDYVTYDPMRIEKALAEQVWPVSLETYVTAITIHELGHAIDRQALLDSLPQSIEVLKMKKSVPASEHYRNPEVLSMLIGEEERNLIAEQTAWDNAEMLNRMHRLVSDEDFKAIQQQSLGSYEHRLAAKIHAYEALTAATVAS